jgi:RNA processing factor Prp31
LYEQVDFDRFKLAYPIKYIPNSLGEVTLTSDEDSEILKFVNSYIYDNAQCARYNFIKEMRTHIPKTIKNVETKIKELNSECENITLETIKKVTSKYGKNKLKQQQNIELATNKATNKIKIEIEKLTELLKDIKTWHSKEDSWHLYELNTIRDWHIIIVCGNYSDPNLDNKTNTLEKVRKKSILN